MHVSKQDVNRAQTDGEYVRLGYVTLANLSTESRIAQCENTCFGIDKPVASKTRLQPNNRYIHTCIYFVPHLLFPVEPTEITKEIISEE